MASTSLKERIDKERGKRKPEEVHDLILDNAHTTNLEGLSSEYENLELLSLVGCSLSSLKGLAKLGKLRRLELSDNKLEDSLDILAESCPALTHVNLSGNKIAKLDVLKPFSSLMHLTHLDLYNCPVTEEVDYRTKVFEMLPNLHYLDGTNRDGEDEPIEDSEDGEDVNDDEGDEEEDYEDDEEEQDEIGLKALNDDDLEDDEVEFDPGNEEEEEEEEDDEDEDEQQESAKRGTKRKHREEEDDEDDDEDDE